MAPDALVKPATAPRRTRKARAPQRSERDIKRELVTTLEQVPRVHVIRINSGGVKTRGGWYSGAPAGTPDVLVLLPGGACCWIETKATKPHHDQKVIAAQARFAEMAARMGHAVLRSDNVHGLIAKVVDLRDNAECAAVEVAWSRVSLLTTLGHP